MDFDADGIDDLISGSYDPGEIYLFRGEGRGKFKARETVTDRSGKPVLRKPDQEIAVESFGSWPAMVDWDGDGDLDLLFGGFDGTLNLRVNEGTRRAPAFATSNTVVEAGGEPVQIPEGHCTPVVADWDGDGRWDILSGAATGAVYWFRNVGKPGHPAFAAAVELLPRHQGIGYSEFLDTDEEPRPGIRSQIDVVDYNGDGKLDLLVGDFCTYLSPRERPLTGGTPGGCRPPHPARSARAGRRGTEPEDAGGDEGVLGADPAQGPAHGRGPGEGPQEAGRDRREAREQGDHRRDGVGEPEV